MSQMKAKFVVMASILFLVTPLLVAACDGSSDTAQDELASSALTEDEARGIALESGCTEVGEIADGEGYNDITKTWWFTLDARPEVAKDGCSPACVVVEETLSAEVNWRCTGLLP